jgi:hypothetical protein
VHRGANADPGLHCEAASEPQHLRAIGLHREIAQETRIGMRTGSHRPAEHGPEPPMQHGMIERGIGPGPEHPVGFAMQPQQFFGE